MSKSFFKRRTSSSSNHSDISNQSIQNIRNAPDDTTDPCYRLSFSVGVAENRNSKYRPTMEDVHTYVANFAERLDWGYFAIFDGHAGKQSAKWCGNNLHSILETEIATTDDNRDMRENMYSAFMEADRLIADTANGSSGCTAAVSIIRWELIDESVDTDETIVPSTATPFDFIPTNNHKRMLYTANVGDSRIILCHGGVAHRLTYDHKGTDKPESDRIINAGGIMMKSRVNGMLAVTRSLGDSYVKDLVIGKPFTTATELSHEDEFLIIACDGLWDVCSDQQAVDLVRDIKDPKEAANTLCKFAIKAMTTDNLTVMVVRLDQSVFGYIGESSHEKEV